MAKEQRKQWAFKPNKKSSTTHHAEGNRMASPTQTVVGKDIPNPLIVEGLLKFLRDLSHFPFQISLPILIHRMVGVQKAVIVSPAK